MDVGWAGIAGEPVVDRYTIDALDDRTAADRAVVRTAAVVLVAELRAVPEVRIAAAGAGNCPALVVAAAVLA